MNVVGIAVRSARRSLVAAVAALAALTGVAEARTPWTERPLELPSRTALQGTSSEPPTWIVAGRPDRAGDAVAARFGARRLRTPGVFVVARSWARALAAALRRRDALVYAEPNVRATRLSSFDDHLDLWPRAAVVPATTAAPPPGSATIAVIDDTVDPQSPDVGPQTRYLEGSAQVVAGAHGTMVASAAAGAYGNGGVTGIYPGAPLLSFGLLSFTCADIAEGVYAAAAVGATAINLSLGSTEDCFTLFSAVSIAYAAGSLVVAAGGNEFLQGNPIVYPAAYPHVLSVASIDSDFRSSLFSNANTAIDIAAPGAEIPLAVPLAFDDDGIPDGTKVADGTSFAAPIVAGAAAWLKTARPDLSNGQLADVLRRSAVDVDVPGFDENTGFGLVNVPLALIEPTPVIDPLEPNDGISFVDGTVIGVAHGYIWRGSGRSTLDGASVDDVEDPFDVYRIRLPGRSRFRIVLRPTYGDPDMEIYAGTAETLDDTDAIVARDLRGPGQRETVALVNTARGARRAYVVVSVDTSTTGLLDAGYRLQFRRVPGRL